MEDDLRTPEEWGVVLGWRVLDPDGWRTDGKSWEEPLTKTEYLERQFISTVQKVAPQG